MREVKQVKRLNVICFVLGGVLVSGPVMHGCGVTRVAAIGGGCVAPNAWALVIFRLDAGYVFGFNTCVSHEMGLPCYCLCSTGWLCLMLWLCVWAHDGTS